MNYRTPQDIQERVEEHYQWAVSAGYEVVGVFLQGSWNYSDKLCDNTSDVDTKCWVVPSFRDLALRKKPVSFTHVMDNNEHCDVKDVSEYIKCFKKQNVNFVEVLFSDYYVINPKYQDLVQMLLVHKEEIVRYNPIAAVDCMTGLMYQKRKALCHRYEGHKDIIDKYGYDGKQLSHAMRMRIMLEHYLNGEPYMNCLHISDNEAEKLYAIKRYKPYKEEFSILSKAEAVEMMDKTIEEAQDLLRQYPRPVNPLVYREELDTLFDNFIIECIQRNL